MEKLEPRESLGTTAILFLCRETSEWERERGKELRREEKLCPSFQVSVKGGTTERAVCCVS